MNAASIPCTDLILLKGRHALVAQLRNLMNPPRDSHRRPRIALRTAKRWPIGSNVAP